LAHGLNLNIAILVPELPSSDLDPVFVPASRGALTVWVVLLPFSVFLAMAIAALSHDAPGLAVFNEETMAYPACSVVGQVAAVAKVE
jgi:hypothetical protein